MARLPNMAERKFLAARAAGSVSVSFRSKTQRGHSSRAIERRLFQHLRRFEATTRIAAMTEGFRTPAPSSPARPPKGRHPKPFSQARGGGRRSWESPLVARADKQAASAQPARSDVVGDARAATNR